MNMVRHHNSDVQIHLPLMPIMTGAHGDIASFRWEFASFHSESHKVGSTRFLYVRQIPPRDCFVADRFPGRLLRSITHRRDAGATPDLTIHRRDAGATTG